MSYQTNLFINNEVGWSSYRLSVLLASSGSESDADRSQYVPSSTGESLTIHNPMDDSVVTDKVQVASEEDVNKAVDAAKAAYPSWAALPDPQRAACMFKFATLLEENADELGKLESICMGQPITVAKRFVTFAATFWRYYAGYAGKIAGESYPPNGDGVYKIVQYEPLGVCAGISAWNGTHLLASW